MSYPIAWRPSPNFNTGWWNAPTNITLHSSASTLASLLATFSTPDRVSAHFTVDPGTRTIYQHVDVANRAWHGIAANEFAIGIEHVDGRAWGEHPELTYDMSVWLVRKIAVDLGLAINEEVIGPHNRWVATACPANLDWRRIIAEAGGTGMAYVDEARFNAWRVALQEQLDTTLVQRAEGDRIVIGLAAAAGVPRTAKRKASARIIVPKLPKAAHPTAKQKADARKGHGRGTSEDVT